MRFRWPEPLANMQYDALYKAGWMTPLLFGTLVYTMLVTPVLIVWGWVRWSKVQPRNPVSIVSVVGFALATTSAALALVTWLVATIKGFQYYDPILLLIYAIGLLISLAGLPFSIVGMWRRGPPAVACTGLYRRHACFLADGGGHRVGARNFSESRPAVGESWTLDRFLLDY
jgi:hypothetical protein